MNTGEVIALIKAFGGSGGGSSGGGVLVVNATESDDKMVCDKTAGEMLSAYKSGTVIIKSDLGGMATYQNVVWVEEYDDDETSFHTLSDTYEALTLDDYPSYQNAN